MSNIQYKIQEETTQHAMRQCFELGKKHFEEVESKSHLIAYNPNIKTVQTVLDLGMISIITCRRIDNNELIGYFANLVTEDFFTSTKHAKEIGIYVKPEYRRLGIWNEMTKVAEDIAREKGAILQVVGFKKNHNEELPLENGYERTETIYQKYLR